MADRRRRKVDGSEESEGFSDSSDEESTQNQTTTDLDTTSEMPSKEPVSNQGESEYESVEEDEGVVATSKEVVRDAALHDGPCLDNTENPAEEEGGEEGTADMLDGDCIDDDEDWKEEQREEGDGEESENLNKEKVLDFDEDRRNPQYIPKKGGFYEHDDRLTEEVAVAVEVEEKAKKGKKKLWKDEGKWMHDRYQDCEQNPKSHDELVTVYGYDIRNEDGPPRARRRRRYGRGPSKYTRKWDDEDAYAKIIPPRGPREGGGTPDSMNDPRGGSRGAWRDRGSRRGGRGYRGGGAPRHDREFPEDDEDDGDGKDGPRHERLTDDAKEWPALDARHHDSRGDAEDCPPVTRGRQQQQQRRDDRRQHQQQQRSGGRELAVDQDNEEQHRYRHPANQESGPPLHSTRDRRGNGNLDAFVPRRGRGSRGGRGLRGGGQAPRARGYNSREQRPADDTADDDHEYEAAGTVTMNAAPDQVITQQMEALDIKSPDDGDSGEGFSPLKESRAETKTSPPQHGSQHERRQASIPPRLQDSVNRPKRYSSQRQRPMPDNVSYPGSAAPHSAPSTIPPRFYDQGYQPQPIYPDHGTPAGVPQTSGVLMSPQPYPFDPTYQDAYARTMPNPQRIYPPLTLAAGQPVPQPAPYIAPTGNMMNYGPPPVTYQQIPYQQYAVPQPPPQVVSVQGDPLKSTLSALQPQPHEIFRGGMAYYNAQPQVVRTLPKRPRAAIPIVPPPEMHRREAYEDMRDSGDVDSPVDDSPNESQTPVGEAEQ